MEENQDLHYTVQKSVTTGAKVLTIEDLPPFLPTEMNTLSTQIGNYLRQLIQEAHKTMLRECLILPSLGSLAVIFDSGQKEVQEALRELRREGFDYFIPGLYGPITLWDREQPEWQNSEDHIHFWDFFAWPLQKPAGQAG